MSEVKHITGDAGGYLVGRRHSNGGIKAINKSTGQPLEMEGGEVVITRDAVSDETKRSFNGKMMTNREILSHINQSGGGVAFEEGGEVPDSIDYIDMQFEYDGEQLDSKGVLAKMALGGELSSLLDGLNSDFSLNQELDLVGSEQAVENFATGGSTRRQKAKISGVLKLVEPLESEFGQQRDAFYIYNAPFPFFQPGGRGSYKFYSTASEAAYIIRQIFKQSFPSQKISVTSSKFSGGDSVDIYPDDPRGWISQEAKDFAFGLERNFRAGTFDGMTDSYDYSKNRPTLKIDAVDGVDWKMDIDKNENLGAEIDIDAKYVSVNNRPKFGSAAYEEFVKIEEQKQEQSVGVPKNNSEVGIEILEPDEQPQQQISTNKDFDTQDEIKKLGTLIDDFQFLIDVTPDYQFEKKAELGSKLSELYSQYNLYASKDNNYLNALRVKTINGVYDPLMRLIKADCDIDKKIKRDPSTYASKVYGTDLVFDGLGELRPSFRNWFGDFVFNKQSDSLIVSQSKVYNDKEDFFKYNPLIVWHGLKNLKDQFRTHKFPTTYFAVNKDYADYFAKVRGGEGYVIPFYLNVRNPLDLTPFGIKKVSPKDFMDYLFLKTSMTPEELGFPSAILQAGIPDLEVWVYIRRFPSFVEAIRKTKFFDGFHFFENNPAIAEDSSGYQTEVWTTFYANQSKAIYDRTHEVLGQDNSMWFKKGGKL
jgi:hypothetical protein